MRLKGVTGTLISDLEVGLLQDACQLVGHRATVRERGEVVEDVLDQLHIVLPHCLQFGLLELLVGLGGGGLLRQERPVVFIL